MIRLLRYEVRALSRDRLLLPMLVLPIGIFYFVPLLLDFVPQLLPRSYRWLWVRPALDLWFAFTPAYLMAFVAGFSILADQDDGVIGYLRGTPLGTGTYVFMKTLLPMALAFVYTGWTVSGWLAPGAPMTLLISLGYLLSAYLFTLLLWRLSPDQVRGLVVAKGLGFLWLLPMLHVYLPSPYHHLAKIVPMGWSMAGVLTGDRWMGLVGMLQAAVYLALLFRWRRDKP